MRLPGYFNTEWDYGCDVLFDDEDFGPGLVLSSFEFAPAPVRMLSQQIIGVSGELDNTDALTGYPTYDMMKATMRLAVTNPREWITPVMDYTLQQFISPEAKFLWICNGRKVRIEFKSSNYYWLSARMKVKSYTKFGAVWDIVLDVTADPYWYEAGLGSVEWNIATPNTSNLFNPSNATIQKSIPDVEIAWDSSGQRYEMRAASGEYADIIITGLTSSHNYTFSCRRYLGETAIRLYDSSGNRFKNWQSITGTTSLRIRVESRSAPRTLCTVSKIQLFDTSSGVGSGTITTYDMPCTELQGRSNAPCTLMVNDVEYDVPARDDLIVSGLNIPPWSTVPVYITAAVACRGRLTYQRGCFSCTL